MNKKGSQTDMIISFALFIVSLIFIYAIIGSPIKFPSQKQTSLNLLKNNVLLASESNFIVERIHSNNSNCIQTTLPTSFNGILTNSAITTGGNLALSCSINSGNLQINSFDGEVKAYYPSNEFDSSISCSTSSLGSCVNIEPSSIIYETLYTQKKIMKIVNQSENNNTLYGSVLGVSNSDNYNIMFIYQNGTTIGKQINNKIKTSIYSSDVQINYLSLLGKEERGVYILQLW